MNHEQIMMEQEDWQIVLRNLINMVFLEIKAEIFIKIKDHGPKDSE